MRKAARIFTERTLSVRESNSSRRVSLAPPIKKRPQEPLEGARKEISGSNLIGGHLLVNDREERTRVRPRESGDQKHGAIHGNEAVPSGVPDQGSERNG